MARPESLVSDDRGARRHSIARRKVEAQEATRLRQLDDMLAAQRARILGEHAAREAAVAGMAERRIEAMDPVTRLAKEIYGGPTEIRHRTFDV